jgi:DNA-binding NtrC family response regulator
MKRDMSKQIDRILVVDDDSSIRQALAIGLASQEIAVDVVENGEEAVRQGYTTKYAVLIADLNLPGMNGIQTVREILRQHPDLIPIIITGKPTEGGYDEAIQIGVSDFLEKPFSLDAIKSAVTQRLAERKGSSSR